jgi:N-acyl-D-aspartate/D-glutamate deacylase
MHELVIRGGTVVDGTGTPRRTADVAVSDGIITHVGTADEPKVDGAARRTIDADGLLVTPGFVDVHTHYDGQATWDPLLTPSSWHGVTTVVMGNCGVGFAPVAPDRHEWLIGLMEGVEDIPGAALAEGITWGWESFPEYLDAIDAGKRSIDLGAQVPHGAVRAYVMGERGARNEPATPEDIERMAEVVREAMVAGALGFSTSRTLAHRAIDGEPVPGTFAAEDELFGIGRVLGELGTGVFELAPAGALGEDLAAPAEEVAWMRRLAAETGRPVSFVLAQVHAAPDLWRELLAECARAVAGGAPLRPQVHARTTSLLLGLSTFHPFSFTPTWSEIALYPPSEQAARMADPDFRARAIEQMHATADDPIVAGFMTPERLFALGDPPDYEPPADRSIAARAAQAGCSPWELLYDELRHDDGRELMNAPILNYAAGNLDAVHEMLVHPATAWGLGDGGAHASQTCDASSSTSLLTLWARDRAGARLTVEASVQKMTSATAALFELGDRGTIAPGFKADLNLVDFDGLRLHRPELVHDLPGGAKRLVQQASGYVATIVSGEVTLEHQEDTGARPGRLLRGATPAPT